MIVIGDVHGCFNTLMALVAQFPVGSKLCFLGDLIDRGPDSKKVVDFVKNSGHLCVLGNHEDMALQAENDDYAAENWLMNGGTTAVESYGGPVTDEHKAWFVSLPFTLEYERYVLSHSNAVPAWGKVDAKTFTIWNRDLAEVFPDGRVNIFGHTPVDLPIVRPGQIMLDTGCVFGRCLSAFDMNSGRFYTQQNIEG